MIASYPSILALIAILGGIAGLCFTMAFHIWKTAEAAERHRRQIANLRIKYGPDPVMPNSKAKPPLPRPSFARRLPNGTFAKGFSGNPAGRPKHHPSRQTSANV